MDEMKILPVVNTSVSDSAYLVVIGDRQVGWFFRERGGDRFYTITGVGVENPETLRSAIATRPVAR